LQSIPKALLGAFPIWNEQNYKAKYIFPNFFAIIITKLAYPKRAGKLLTE
jgi:hypothetical protein